MTSSVVEMQDSNRIVGVLVVGLGGFAVGEKAREIVMESLSLAAIEQDELNQ